MPDQDADLFPALLAAALYARRNTGPNGRNNLGGLLVEPNRPLDYTPNAEAEVETEAELELAA